MDLLDSSIDQTTRSIAHTLDTIITVDQYLVIVTVNSVFLSSLVGVLGIAANVINAIVFYKQGLDSSINVTFFALSISDLSALLIQQVFNVFENPLFLTTDMTIMPSEFQYLIAGLPRAVFSRITCLITVYITLERCLCISFPLHVKQMITPRRTSLAMIVIYTLTWISFLPLYCTAYIGWKFYTGRNRTLLGLVVATNNDEVSQITCLILAFLGLALFVAVVIFTLILIKQLAEKSKWRIKSTVTKDTCKTALNRDRRTGSMVVLIASILIASNTPTLAMCVGAFVEPEFNVNGRYHYMFFALGSFGFLFETINSSVNILLFLKMSTKYRDTFRELFTRKQRKLVFVSRL